MAGAILTTECGLHRFRPPLDDPRHLLATRLTLRVHLEKKDWVHRALLPVMPANIEMMRRHPVVREHWLEPGEVRFFGSKERTYALGGVGYWDAIDELALRHLLLCLDRDPESAEDAGVPAFESLWVGPLDEPEEGARP
jgi:hypothetical protein